ncbi:MAG: AAA family ATPase [Planctomycetales bacterium]
MLDLLIRSGNPLISIETTDEERAVERVREVAARLRQPLCEWSLTDGLQRREADGRFEKILPGARPVPALAHIAENLNDTLYLFKDLGPHCKDAQVHRMVRDLLPECSRRKSALVLVDALPLPDEIRRFTVAWELPCPSPDELEEIVKRTFQRLHRQHGGLDAKLTRTEMEQLVQALRGLGASEAERVVASAILHDNLLTVDDLPHIVEAKRTLLRSAGCLESIAVDFAPEDIGGLDNLKRWLARRRGGFSRKAREFGLEPPRGVLMLGVPGSGKSLCAKVVAADWKMPLLRLDPGVLYQKFIGESESQLRQALRQAEAMAPAVLWIDEIEKAFASASAASADGGLSKRMFGTLLSWMQDHRHPIFIIATANDIAALPPELMRKGRFDEVFFVDLPVAAARREIFAIHLRRRKRDPARFDLARLAETAEGFTGSEIEQAIVSALFSAFAEDAELANGHVEAALRETRPLHVLMAERIAELRAWAADRCVPAD